ncbi:tail fiber assembly protein [Pseudomonas corrugata]|uniref:tail fiber assembly protein n=1 Tax=Pseudomonas corrugata TaxID=47879 RepID=UPI0006D89AC2|nr:tail fiber assembly protein [Pseudomonas corrugata]
MPYVQRDDAQNVIGIFATLQAGYAEEYVEEEPELFVSQQQKAEAAISTRDRLLRHASAKVAPLQYAADVGEASEAELAGLNAWKRYSLDLSRIQNQADFPYVVIWPEAPNDY